MKGSRFVQAREATRSYPLEREREIRELPRQSYSLASFHGEQPSTRCRQQVVCDLEALAAWGEGQSFESVCGDDETECFFSDGDDVTDRHRAGNGCGVGW